MDDDMNDDVSIHDDSSTDDDAAMDDDASIAAEAADHVTRCQAALQVTLEQQARENTDAPPPLEDLLMANFGEHSEEFAAQREKFEEMPGPILEKFAREAGPKWREPPFLDFLVSSNSRHLSLNFNKNKKYSTFVDDPLDATLAKIAEQCKNSLRTLEITELGTPCGREGQTRRSALSVAQLCSLLLELRGLKELHLLGDIDRRDVDGILSVLAVNNANVEVISVPKLTVKTLTTISTRWPNFKTVHAYDTSFDSSDLKKMASFTLDAFITKSTTMLPLARAYDPTTSSPYKQAGNFSCSDIREKTNTPVTNQDMILLFDSFPRVNSLELWESDLAAVCAALQGRENVHITQLDASSETADARAFEPLLTQVGHDLLELKVFSGQEEGSTSLDLAMVGHYCPRLRHLCLMSLDHVTAGQDYETSEATFSQLKSLLTNTYVLGADDGPDPLFRHLLCGPLLEVVTLWSLDIPQTVLDFLVSGQEDQMPLMAVKKLGMFSPLMSRANLADLVARMPKLRELVLWELRSDNEEDLERNAKTPRVMAAFCSLSGLKAKVIPG